VETIKYRVVNGKGQEVGTIDLEPAVFGAPVLQHMVHTEVCRRLKQRRAGTHSCLNKGSMKGGGRKPWRQKGTGRARCGSNTSPLWVGGAVAHGPKPHDYRDRLAKRARCQALVAALSDKVQNKELIVLSELELQAGKTKELKEILRNVGAGAGGATLVLAPSAASSEKIKQAGRNINRTITLPPQGVNVYDLLKHKYLVSTCEGIASLQALINSRLEAHSGRKLGAE